MDRLRDLAAVGGVDRIYVHSPDRLARNYAYQVLLIDEWRRAGVEIVFLNRSLGQSPEDDLLLQVQGIVSEYERAKIMERSRRGKKHAAQRGSLNVMSHAPFGYPRSIGAAKARSSAAGSDLLRPLRICVLRQDDSSKREGPPYEGLPLLSVLWDGCLPVRRRAHLQ
jgi:hypothetical protein